MAFHNQLYSSPGLSIRFSFGVLLGLLIGICVLFLQDKNCESGLCRGDFPVFYSSAKLAASGDLDKVYNHDVQQELQNKFWPSLKGHYYFFPYPPYFAQNIAWLSQFEPATAKFMYVLLSLALLLVSCLLFKVITTIEISVLILVTLVLSNATVLVGAMSGQNVALTTSLYLLLIFVLSRKNPISLLFAGIILGALYFKPHFGIVFSFFALYFLNKGRGWLICGLVAALSFQFLLSATVLGVDWPLNWVNAVSKYKAIDHDLNRHQIISLYPLVELTLSKIHIISHYFITFFHLLLSLFILWATLKVFRDEDPDDRDRRLHGMMLAGPFVVITSPPILFYDFGLLLFPLIYFALQDGKRGWGILLSLTVVSAICCIWKDSFSLQPLLFISLAVYMYCLWQINILQNEKLGDRMRPLFKPKRKNKLNSVGDLSD